MKTVILAGGLGTRLGEETSKKPKPMVEIGGWPILWHIMNIYSNFGHKDFTVALGYKGHVIKDFFINYYRLQNNLSIDLETGDIACEKRGSRDWKVDLIDTGLSSMTGGRLFNLKDRLQETFLLTYGDGVADVNIDELLKFHRSHGKLLTVTAVRPMARFGCLTFDGDQVIDFQEKPSQGEGWINGGFFVVEPEVLSYLDGTETVFEREPLERLSKEGQMMAYRHSGFWQCMDTVRDRETLETHWERGDAPWAFGRGAE